jgi:hypothetical protein
VDYERAGRGPALYSVDAGHGFGIEGVGSQAVHGLGREGDEAAGAQEAGGLCDLAGISGATHSLIVDGGSRIYGCRDRTAEKHLPLRTPTSAAKADDGERLIIAAGAESVSATRGNPSPWLARLFLLLVLGRFLDCEVISHPEYSLNAVGLDAGYILVHLPGHHAFESHISILDDDVNGRNGAQLVLA